MLSSLKPRILIVDDDQRARDFLSDFLTTEDYTVLTAPDGETALKTIRTEDLNLVLLDLLLPDINGIEVLKRIKEYFPTLPVIMISGFAQIQDAVAATKAGAYDFLEKGNFDKERFILTIRNALERERLGREITYLKEEALKKYQMVGVSEPIRKIFNLIEDVAKSNASVLIVGETGVGKELVARAIHNKSQRKDGPFVKMNCAAVPETLIESELFGYEKGAFTGAVSQKLGKLEVANKGTLFLDEVGDLSLSAQAKLLRFLQEGKFERLGGTEVIGVQARIISATNKNLKEEIEKKGFREDLYYRLNVINIYVPPLRERKEDIAVLADYFLGRYCEENGVPRKHLTPEAIKFLQGCPWKGNVRELENFIARASILIKSLSITAEELLTIMEEDGISRPDRPKKTLKSATEEFQREYILRLLVKNNWNKAKTAEELDIERTHLYRKIKELGITP